MFLTGHVTDEAPSRQSSGYDQPVRLTGGLRAQPNWGEVEIAWDDCSLLLGRVQDGLGRLHAAFSDLAGQAVLDLEELLSDLATNVSFLGRLRARVRALISEPSHQEIYWLTVGAQDQEITLHRPAARGRVARRFVVVAKGLPDPHLSDPGHGRHF
jgi:hypothetical protein